MAKSYNNQWGKMIDLDNIIRAIYAAARGKRRKASVRKALAHVEETALYIQDLLVNDKWRPPEVRQGYIFEDGIIKKKRLIIHPDFTEQVVHHLLIDQVIAPIFGPTFYRWSCGSIPGRGQEGMAKYVTRMARKHAKRMRNHVEHDIAQCFDTIQVKSIHDAIAAKVRDKRVMHIVNLVLGSNAIRLPDGTIKRTGVPIGLYTSPWFVNIVLSKIDHYVKDEKAILLFLRFIDDMEFVDSNRRKIDRIVDDIERLLAKDGMRLKKKGGARPCVKSFKTADGWKVRYTGFHFMKKGALQVHDSVFLRAQRAGARMRRKMAVKKRVTAFDASKMISYGGRFRAFGSYNAFTTRVLCGKIKYFALRQKIADRDRRRNKSLKIRELIETIKTKGTSKL